MNGTDPWRMTFEEGSNFAEAPLSSAQTGICPLILYRGERFWPIGSCFAISNAPIFVTARHVIEEVVPELVPDQRLFAVDRRYGEGLSKLDRALAVLSVSLGANGKYHFTMLQVGEVVISQPSDMILFGLHHNEYQRFGPDLRLPALPIALDMPTIGQEIGALGYPNTGVEHDGERTKITASFSVTVGEITNVFPNGRDRGLLNFPCFETNARFASGMSGGPVISADGNVLGMICSSPDHEDGVPDVSYAALIPPLVTFNVPGCAPLAQEKVKILWDLVDIGALVPEMGSAKVNRGETDIAIMSGDGLFYRKGLRPRSS